MEDKDLIAKLNELRRLPDETECVEFEEAKTTHDIDKIGRYFSALSNEANLKDKEFGWLIFAVKDSDKSIVGEKEDELIFTNLGEFIPGSVEIVVKSDTPAERYKNGFLAEAMFNFKMMFNERRRRLFPMPEYDLSNRRVKVTVTGKILDPKYASILVQENDLTLDEIIMLDRVQKDKGKSLSATEIKSLRRRGLIEGTKPNYFISAQVAQKTGQKAEYMRFRGLDKSFYLEMIINAVNQYDFLTRKDINKLLWDKLPDIMTDKQRTDKIGNLIRELRVKKEIINTGTDGEPKWVKCK